MFSEICLSKDQKLNLFDAFEIKKASLPSPVDTTTTTITADSGNNSEGSEPSEHNKEPDEQSASNTEQFESVEPETDEKSNLLA